MTTWGPAPCYLFRIARIAAVVVSLVFAPSVARGAEVEPRSTGAVILVDTGDSAAALRIAAELQASGLTVLRALQGARMTPGEFGRIAQSAAAAAVIEVEPETGEVAVWTAEGPTFHLVLRSEISLEGAPAVVALRTAEAVRDVLHKRAALAPTATHSLASGATEALAAEATGLQKRERRPAPAGELGVSLGPAFAFGGGRFSGSWQGLVTLHWLWAGRWGVEVAGIFPLSSEQRSSSEGSAELTFGFVVAGAGGRLVATRWASLDVSAGAGAAAIRTRGFPGAPDVSATDRLSWVAAPYGRIGYVISIAGPLRARADVIGALLVPRPILIAGDPSPWGAPLIVASAGLELTFR